MKCVFVVLLASMMTTVNSCEFGNDAIQSMHDRAEAFRKTNVFDTTNGTVPWLQYYRYQYREDTDGPSDGSKHLRIEINNEKMSEIHKNNAANEIETIAGSYRDLKSQLEFRRDENGKMIFQLWRNNIFFQFTLPSIDAELPNNIDADEDCKQVLLDLKTMRQKMFDYQKGFNKNDFERVEVFDYMLFSNGDFRFFYAENDGGKMIVESAKKDGKETIFGEIKCNKKQQKYNVVDGKVAVDGEPFFPPKW